MILNLINVSYWKLKNFNKQRFRNADSILFTDVKVPLPEDRDLQGFLPLEKVFEPLRFTSTDLEGDVVSLNKLRAARILDLGQQLSEQRVNGTALISIAEGDHDGRDKFTAGSEGAGLSKELWKELEELSLNKEKQPLGNASPVPSESASSKGSWEADILELAGAFNSSIMFCANRRNIYPGFCLLQSKSELEF